MYIYIYISICQDASSLLATLRAKRAAPANSKAPVAPQPPAASPALCFSLINFLLYFIYVYIVSTACIWFLRNSHNIDVPDFLECEPFCFVHPCMIKVKMGTLDCEPLYTHANLIFDPRQVLQQCQAHTVRLHPSGKLKRSPMPLDVFGFSVTVVRTRWGTFIGYIYIYLPRLIYIYIYVLLLLPCLTYTPDFRFLDPGI